MDYHTCSYTQNVLSQKWFDLCPQIDEWNILNPLSSLSLWQFNAIELFPGTRQLVACAAADNVGNSGSGGRLDWGSLSNPPHAVASCPRAHPCCPFACPSCPFFMAMTHATLLPGWTSACLSMLPACPSNLCTDIKWKSRSSNCFRPLLGSRWFVVWRVKMLSSHNLSLLMLNLSKFLRGLLRLLHGFVKVVIYIPCPLPNKTKLSWSLSKIFKLVDWPNALNKVRRLNALDVLCLLQCFYINFWSEFEQKAQQRQWSFLPFPLILNNMKSWCEAVIFYLLRIAFYFTKTPLVTFSRF